LSERATRIIDSGSGKKRISKAALYVRNQVTLELNRLGELVVPHFQADHVNGCGGYQDLVSRLAISFRAQGSIRFELIAAQST
jgi:hypothetical protein